MFSLAGCGDDDEMPEEGEEIEEIEEEAAKCDYVLSFRCNCLYVTGTSVNIDGGFVGTL